MRGVHVSRNERNLCIAVSASTIPAGAKRISDAEPTRYNRYRDGSNHDNIHNDSIINTYAQVPLGGIKPKTLNALFLRALM
jgi:hypothetical protein